MPHDAPSFGRRGVRTNRHTLVVNQMRGQEVEYLLYDRIADPYQLKNIARDEPELIDQLVRDELVPWLRRTNDPWLTRH